MAADADGAQADQAGFAGAFAADVAEVFAVMAHDDIGDELLEGGVFFNLGARQETGHAGDEDGAAVAFHVELQAVEDAQLFDYFSFDN
ncbi:MAG: hypothetical protein BWY71_00146 [Planctomycetes bacterium ADurb.Bin412]|nr:MAG: hypothetical protein BWY71_00146 [Planctomycetes bacterium ADurb.Bin412]